MRSEKDIKKVIKVLESQIKTWENKGHVDLSSWIEYVHVLNWVLEKNMFFHAELNEKRRKNS